MKFQFYKLFLQWHFHFVIVLVLVILLWFGKISDVLFSTFLTLLVLLWTSSISKEVQVETTKSNSLALRPVLLLFNRAKRDDSYRQTLRVRNEGPGAAFNLDVQLFMNGSWLPGTKVEEKINQLAPGGDEKDIYRIQDHNHILLEDDIKNIETYNFYVILLYYSDIEGKHYYSLFYIHKAAKGIVNHVESAEGRIQIEKALEKIKRHYEDYLMAELH